MAFNHLITILANHFDAMEFKQSLVNTKEWYATLKFKEVEIEFCVDASYFVDNIIIWEHVDLITTQLLKDFDFIYEISKRWAIRLYNGYGNDLTEIDKFTRDGCEFQKLLLVRLYKSTRKYDNDHFSLRNSLRFLVENVFDSEFTYMDSSCLFTIYRETYFVGVMSSSIQL